MNNKNLYIRNGKNVFRVNRIFNIKISEECCNVDYILRSQSSNDLTETGLITVFSIEPKSKKSIMPSFSGRWDQNKQILDIDILGVTKKTVNLFKTGKDGYLGHHLKIISASPRLFAINIRIPDVEIFRGTITFNVNHGHGPIPGWNFFGK